MMKMPAKKQNKTMTFVAVFIHLRFVNKIVNAGQILHRRVRTYNRDILIEQNAQEKPVNLDASVDNFSDESVDRIDRVSVATFSKINEYPRSAREATTNNVRDEIDYNGRMSSKDRQETSELFPGNGRTRPSGYFGGGHPFTEEEVYDNFLYPRDHQIDNFRYDSKKFCGESLESASLCSLGCPLGLDIECPSGQSCFDIDSCVDEPSPSEDLGGNNMFCGSKLNDASECLEGKACPSGLNSECPSGETCYHISSCNTFCGSSITTASRCSISCPSGLNSECPIGEKCHHVKNCNTFCGSSLNNASQCSKSCPSGANSECLAGQTCHKVKTCEDPNPIDSTSLYCGTSLAGATECSIKCPSGDSSDCPIDQHCFFVESCSMFCGSSFSNASRCAMGCVKDSDCAPGEHCYSVQNCHKCCGASPLGASDCTKSCPSGLDYECPQGQSCFDIREKVQPTADPTARLRLVVRVLYTFCLEHGILTPVYRVLRNTDKSIKNLLTQKFLDNVVDIDPRWNIDETHLQVESVETTWIKDSSHLQCSCEFEDLKSICTAVEASVYISFWDGLDPDLIRYILLKYQEYYITDNMKYPATYLGFVPFESQNKIRLYGAPPSQMSEDALNTFVRTIKRYLNEDMKGYGIPGMEVLVTAVNSVSIITHVGVMSNKRCLDGIGAEVDATITGQYIPPPTIDIGKLINQSLKRGTDDIADDLKKSGNPYFQNLSPNTSGSESNDAVDEGLDKCTNVGENVSKRDDDVDIFIDQKETRNSNVHLILGILCIVIITPTVLFLFCCRRKICTSRNGDSTTDHHDFVTTHDDGIRAQMRTLSAYVWLPEARPLHEIDPSEQDDRVIHVTNVTIL